MYSTYDDARRREIELLHLAQRQKIGEPGPARRQRVRFRLDVSTLLAALRPRYIRSRKPAIGRAA